MIIDCISDLHGYYPTLEGGDLLIVAGDLTARDRPEEHMLFSIWIEKQHYKKIVWIAGNHDNFYQNHCKSTDDTDIAYLCDSGTEFEGLKIWGSPWTKTFPRMNPHCKAFTCDTEEELAEKWALIPDDIHILITHGPPYGILDKAKRFDYPKTDTRIGKFLNEQYENVGSKSLALKIGTMVIPPKLWVWGHIHEAYGEDMAIRGKQCKMVNCSHVNERYQPVNKPVRIIL